MDNKGQGIILIIRAFIALVGIWLVISGVDTLSATGPILERLTTTAYGWIKILVGLILTLMGISPQSVVAVIRIP